MNHPKNPFHPGEILLEEFLKPAEITQLEFANRLGWTRARLNEFIKGKRGVSAATRRCTWPRSSERPRSSG